MFHPIDYFKYGKVVHRSSNGNVIRRKINYPGFFDIKTGHISTTKTILNEEGAVQRQLERTGYIDRDFTSTTTRPILYNQYNGMKLAPTEQPRTKTYLNQKEEKILTDNTKPGYDYKYEVLPDGRTKYTIAYPETTVVNKKEGTVVTDMQTKEVIVDKK